MSQDSSPTGQPRGFFFDLTPQAVEETKSEQGASSSNLSTGTYPPRRARSKDARHSPDWWEADNCARAAAAKGLAKQQRLEVEMSLPPEHLPSSPLCPKHSMHKSKGRGICVYHGRRRSVSLRSGDGGDSSGYSYEYDWYEQ